MTTKPMTKAEVLAVLRGFAQTYDADSENGRAFRRAIEIVAAWNVSPDGDVVDGINTESADFKEGFAVGRAESEYLCELIRAPRCATCGARNAVEAETMCRPSDDSCPGVEWPLEQLWAMQTTNAALSQLAQQGGESKDGA